MQLSNVKQNLHKSKSSKIGHQALGSKQFFEQFSTNRKNTIIETLSDAKGNLTSRKGELEMTHTFHQQFYNDRPTDPSATQDYLQHISQRTFADNEDNEQFQKLIT